MKKILTLFALAASLFFSPAAPAQTPATQSGFDFSFDGVDGTPIDLTQYKGKVLLIVNTASECGLAGQFQDLQKLHETYADKGLVVIGVPANDFGGQEPLDGAAIATHTRDTYGVTFPLTGKTAVSGPTAHPFYLWAAAEKKGGLLSSVPRWNFHKYIVGRDGQLVDSIGSTTSPLDTKVIATLEQALSLSTPASETPDAN